MAAWHSFERGDSALSLPHPEERPLGRVSKDAPRAASWFETREDALLTMRVRQAEIPLPPAPRGFARRREPAKTPAPPGALCAPSPPRHPTPLRPPQLTP